LPIVAEDMFSDLLQHIIITTIPVDYLAEFSAVDECHRDKVIKFIAKLYAMRTQSTITK